MEVGEEVWHRPEACDGGGKREREGKDRGIIGKIERRHTGFFGFSWVGTLIGLLRCALHCRCEYPRVPSVSKGTLGVSHIADALTAMALLNVTAYAIVESSTPSVYFW